jgi:heat-inducible transcriptional repressor
MTEVLDERSRRILHAVIQSYIQKPEPVGSRFVTKKYSLGFSPATIRNIMADLEDLGLLSQPHTSAGRVPTDRGYRYYVNNLLGTETPREAEDVAAEFVRTFTRKLEGIKNDLSLMFSEVTDTLSSLSNYIGIALPPRAEQTRFTRIDLIKYKSESVVAILVTEERLVKSRIFGVDPRLSQDDLNRIADYLNAEFSGRTIDEIRQALTDRMQHEKVLWDNLISRAIGICEKALSFAESDIFVSGLYEAMALPDFADISRIRGLSRAIKDKHTMLRLLDRISQSEGVQVVIGEENSLSDLRQLSIVASSYSEAGRPMGVIALVGPTRMDYSMAISMVDTVARCISRTFESP